jgi:hypothetical protein
MWQKRWLLLILALGLMAGCLCGCRAGNRPPWDESGSLLDMLALADQTVSSIEIQKAGENTIVIVDDAAQIQNVLNRLDQVKVVKNLGHRGYSMGGYGLTFNVVTAGETRKESIQVAVAEGDDIAHYGGAEGYYYEISDQGADELNNYFAVAAYTFR